MPGEAGTAGFFGSGVIRCAEVQFLPLVGAQGEIYSCSGTVRGNLGWADILAGQHVQPGRVTAGFSGTQFVETTLEIPPLEGSRPVALEDQELQAIRQGAARLT